MPLVILPIGRGLVIKAEIAWWVSTSMLVRELADCPAYMSVLLHEMGQAWRLDLYKSIESASLFWEESLKSFEMAGKMWYVICTSQNLYNNLPAGTFWYLYPFPKYRDFKEIGNSLLILFWQRHVFDISLDIDFYQFLQKKKEKQF